MDEQPQSQPQDSPSASQPAPQVSSNKDQANIMSFISYVSFLCLIPILMREKNETIKFHARQGLVIFAGEVITWIFIWIFPGLYIFGNLLGILWAVLSIIGIINVYRGDKKEIPIIGKLASGLKI